MDTWQAIDTTRTIRSFADRSLDEAHLRRILDAGRRAGSSKNLQRWDFIVCTDREHLRELAAVGDYAGHLAGAAAAVALVTPDPTDRTRVPLSVMFDLGRAAQNMTLAAWELGVGSVPATVYDQALARRLLGYPEDRWCEYLLSFGYPADPTQVTRPNRPGGRRALADIVHRERWQGSTPAR
ncbi:MAG TPA: nitroreductase family protein [Candidatus Limnocylindrales bacterium]